LFQKQGSSVSSSSSEERNFATINISNEFSSPQEVTSDKLQVQQDIRINSSADSDMQALNNSFLSDNPIRVNDMVDDTFSDDMDSRTKIIARKQHEFQSILNKTDHLGPPKRPC